jgi:hypothetical protein
MFCREHTREFDPSIHKTYTFSGVSFEFNASLKSTGARRQARFFQANSVERHAQRDRRHAGVYTGVKIMLTNCHV